MSRKFAALLIVSLAIATPLWAQAVTQDNATPNATPPLQGLGLVMPNQKTPIAIEADNGLEWRREENVYIARGNATAQSGELKIRADELRGYYRSTADSQFELYKLEAIGGVVLNSGEQSATAEKAFYDLDQKAFVLLGEKIELRSAQATLIANDRIEYWQDRNLAVARGGAVAIQGPNRLMAQTVTAHFTPGANGKKPSVQSLDASGEVRIEAKQNLAQAESASYDLSSNLVTLRGNVRLTQGPNQLNGEFAELNTQTGVSRILGNKDATKGQARVRALIIPNAAKNTSSF